MANCILTYKFRAYPTRQQVVALEAQLAEACRLYNAALQERRDAWRMQRKAVSYPDQTTQLTQIRAAGDLAIPSYDVAKEVLRRVDLAFRAFFSRVRRGQKAGYPRFRSVGRYDSLRTRDAGSGIYSKAGGLYVMGVGVIRIRQHRQVNGVERAAAICRQGGKWFATIEVATPTPAQLQPSTTAVGIDVGLESFAALSSGEVVPSPRLFRAAELKLRRAQRHLARCKRGSARRRKAVQRVAALHRSVSNRRSDFTHKLSRRIINEHGLVAVERLRVAGLARTRLSKSINDAGWRLFLDQLAYKAAWAGRDYVEVNPAGTSQTCTCGTTVPKKLSDRWHDCPSC